ncbi:DUF5681 domain-containing protein [Bradyrhizobium brasilense]|uniref:DUF5681 domain-containing protein n=1 Tax=Bradyrhizobium brasilense TaxID=1419277 RepID=UPI001E515051|nr:DUF5681 domain-containing protein [Bradyrhizobium brasilense]MCC8971770.1 hypothetical protein [Bradyrhizobium brasilense]
MIVVKRVRFNSKRRQSNADVGYGKPPKHTRFKPGQSGNPNGRPKGVRNFKTDVCEALQTPAKVSKNGRVNKMTTQRAGLETLCIKALKGDPRALEQLLRLGERHDEPKPAVDVPIEASDQAILDAYFRRMMEEKLLP